MNTPFITENFLLSSEAAIELYERFARTQPIIDYHCHLSPSDIARDRRFDNLGQLWLEGDHYKWRAMRANGVDERFITGGASDREKFQAWAETVPSTLRNPLYHWTHMELKRPFGIGDVLLSGHTAETVWQRTREQLARPAFSARGLLRQMNVEVVCTTDDPIDSLSDHARIRADRDFPVRVLPTFRADAALGIEHGDAWQAYVRCLGEVAGLDIACFADLLEALRKRHDFFHEQGCRLSDHGLETAHAADFTESEVEQGFCKALAGVPIEKAGVEKFKSALLIELCRMDHARGWVQQLHLGTFRNINPRAYRELGPDTGFDAIGEAPVGASLARLLGRLEGEGALARTIVYNLNPAHNESIATIVGSFQDGRTPGKMQYGAAWWFLDQRDGISRQIEALSNMGLLSRFVGMLTDSRSFLSYSRHDYFRRILCDLLGTEMERGLLPRDFDLVGGMVADICYRNARRYFGFHEGAPDA